MIYDIHIGNSITKVPLLIGYSLCSVSCTYVTCHT